MGELKSWMYYILNSFGELKSTPSAKENKVVLVSGNNTETIIEFYFADNSVQLTDVCFFNRKSKFKISFIKWKSGCEGKGYIPFVPENIQDVEKFLHVPRKLGWVQTELIYKNRIIRLEVLVHDNDHCKGFYVENFSNSIAVWFYQMVFGCDLTFKYCPSMQEMTFSGGTRKKNMLSLVNSFQKNIASINQIFDRINKQ